MYVTVKPTTTNTSSICLVNRYTKRKFYVQVVLSEFNDLVEKIIKLVNRLVTLSLKDDQSIDPVLSQSIRTYSTLSTHITMRGRSVRCTSLFELCRQPLIDLFKSEPSELIHEYNAFMHANTIKMNDDFYLNLVEQTLTFLFSFSFEMPSYYFLPDNLSIEPHA